MPKLAQTTAVFLALAQTVSCIAAPPLALAQTVATPQAVPVGVPIAQQLPYAYGQHLQTTSPKLSDAQLDKLADKIAARMSGQTVAAQATVDPQKLYDEKCAGCHDGGQAKLIGADSPPQLRRDAIARMVTAEASRRMPKGGQLTETEFQGVA